MNLNGLAAIAFSTGQGREQLARAVDLLHLDGRGVGELIGPYAKGHHDFPEHRAAGPLADTFDGGTTLDDLRNWFINVAYPSGFKTTIWQIWDSLPEPLSLAKRGPAIRRALRARYTLPAPARRTASHRVEAAETASPRPMRKAVR